MTSPLTGLAIGQCKGHDAADLIANADSLRIELSWSTFNPADGVYDWTPLTDQTQHIRPGMPVILDITAGTDTPQWLMDALGPDQCITLNLPRFRGGTPAPMTVPLPWAPGLATALQDAWLALLAKLADLGLGEPIAYRAMGTFSGPGGLFSCVTDGSEGIDGLWAQAGYRPSVVQAAWVAQIAWFAANVPGEVMVTPDQYQTEWPSVDESGAVVTPSTSNKQALDILNAGYAVAPGLIVVDVAANDAPDPRWLAVQLRAAGRLIFPQPNTWAGNGLPATGSKEHPVLTGAAAFVAIQAFWAPTTSYMEINGPTMRAVLAAKAGGFAG